jgi:hypothetical protein
MANCKSCTHSADYLDPKDKITKLICLSPRKETMATVEGEHECDGYDEVLEGINFKEVEK